MCKKKSAQIIQAPCPASHAHRLWQWTAFGRAGCTLKRSKCPYFHCMKVSVCSGNLYKYNLWIVSGTLVPFPCRPSLMAWPRKWPCHLLVSGHATYTQLTIPVTRSFPFCDIVSLCGANIFIKWDPILQIECFNLPGLHLSITNSGPGIALVYVI